MLFVWASLRSPTGGQTKNIDPGRDVDYYKQEKLLGNRCNLHVNRTGAVPPSCDWSCLPFIKPEDEVSCWSHMIGPRWTRQGLYGTSTGTWRPDGVCTSSEFVLFCLKLLWFWSKCVLNISKSLSGMQFNTKEICTSVSFINAWRWRIYNLTGAPSSNKYAF